MARKVKTQNDIADFLRGLIEFLKEIADFFDSLNESQKAKLTARLMPTATNLYAADLDCIDGLLEGLKADGLEAVQVFVERLPSRFNELVECMFNGESDSVQLRAQNELYGRLLACAIPAVLTWLRTQDVGAAINQFLGCLLGGNDGGDGGGPNFRSDRRCR